MSSWDKEVRLQEQTWSFFVRGMKIIWNFLGKEKRTAVWVVIMMAISSALSIVPSYLLKMVADKVQVVAQTKQIGADVLWLLIGILLSTLVFDLFDRLVLEGTFLKFLIRLEQRWPEMAQQKLLELSVGYHERENTGKKISKIIKGCERMIDIVGKLRWSVGSRVVFIFINATVILMMDWRLGLMFVIPIVPAGWLFLLAFSKYAPHFEEYDKQKEVSLGVFCQSIINVSTVQNYVQERREELRHSTIREKMKELDIEGSMGMQKYLLAANLIINNFFLASVVVGLYLVSRDKCSLGTVVYLVATGNRSFSGLWQIVHDYIDILRKLISVTRMNVLLEEKPEVCNTSDVIIPQSVNGLLEVKSVAFSYQEKNDAVLDGIDLSIAPNEMVAFVGKSGEGKTTLVKLLCRIHEVSSGSISLDGLDIRKLDLFWYRRLFAIVRQDVEIFDATIRENVAYAFPTAKDVEVESALRAANLDSVIGNKSRFPDGIETQVGERGVKLSGGEKQRVGIARAYLALQHGARFLVLDEATSNLDSQTERAIQGMLNDLKKNSSISIIAIAHRLSTIRRADTIYVIEGGKVVEKGNHEKLSKRNGLYARLVDLQKLGEVSGGKVV